MLIGFVITYAATRWIRLRIRARKASGADEADTAVKDVYFGGVHIHHPVWGILLVLVVGQLEFRLRPDSPGPEVLARLFGAGAARALDECALWLHLEDVYSSEERRKSIDAVMVVVVLPGQALLHRAEDGSVGEAFRPEHQARRDRLREIFSGGR